VRPKLKGIIRTVWIASGIAATAWLYVGFQAAGVPDDAVKSDRQTTVVAGPDGLDFRSLTNPKRSSLIFLPGGMVDPVAYAPLLKGIAGMGYRAHLLYLPLRCACTDSQTRELFESIRRVVDSEPDTAWVLAGHSRGAMLSARFAQENQTRLAGLVLIATTHPRDFTLADLRIPVTKIFGTRDGVAPHNTMRQNSHLLPPNTAWVGIAGGNHVQFGYYRHQLGDNAATISRHEQQAAVRTELAKALERVSAPK